jgi:hypothetical protein
VGKERRRNGDSKPLRCLEVDDQLGKTLGEIASEVCNETDCALGLKRGVKGE